MYSSAITSLSTKGQVVIPDEIRKRIGLKEGSKFMVFTDGANVMLKPILSPSMVEFEKMASATRSQARKAGLKKSDVVEAIEKVRRRARGS